MKKVKGLTVLNLCFSVFAWCLFIFNQLCNLRFLGLWVAWTISGYGYALLIGPISAVVSGVCTAVSFTAKPEFPKQNKYVLINAICTVITWVLLISCFAIEDALTWA